VERILIENHPGDIIERSKWSCRGNSRKSSLLLFNGEKEEDLEVWFLNMTKTFTYMIMRAS